MFWKLKRLPLTRAAAVVNAAPSAVYDILTDYDSYLEWFPFTNHSKLLVKEGDLAITEFAFDRPIGAKLTVECIHTKNEMVLNRRISGNMPLTRVQWNLAPDGEGTRVTLRTEMDLRNWRMLHARTMRNFMFQSLLRSLQGRVAAFSSDLQTDGGRKFLELIQTDDGLEIWLLGKRYKLTAMDDKGTS